MPSGRSAFLLSLVGLAAAAAPASAAPLPVPTLYFSGGTHKGYKLRGSLDPAGLPVITLSKTKKHFFESHTLGRGSSNQFVPMKYKGNYSSATIKRSFGPFGSVDLKFKATGKKSPQKVPGCRGAAQVARQGIVTGTLKLRFDKHFFKTVKETKMPAVLSTVQAFACSAAPTPPRGSALTASYGGVKFGTLRVLDYLPTHGLGVETATYTPKTPAQFAITHTVAVSGPRSKLTFAANHSSARVTGFSPFSGQLVYAATTQGPGTTSGTITHGTSIKFDSSGTVKLPATAQGSLG